MSQIRKLQNGGTSKYGVLRIGNTVYDTPEAIDAFEGFLRAGDKSYAPITGKWMDYIRKGHDVSINPIDNTIEISGVSADDYSDLYGATKRQRRILESGKPTFGGNNFSTKFRDAVYYASGFSGPTKSAETKSKKTKVSNGKIKIDYDTIDGVQKYSDNPSNKLIDPQIAAYLAYLGDEKWGEANEWENELGDNDHILKAWYNGFEGDKGAAAKAAIDVALAEVRSKPWNEVSEASRELLAYFNIVGPDGQVNGSTSNSSYVDENGQIKKNAQNSKGQWGTYRGNGENGTTKDALYTTYDAGELPYLINADRLGLFEGLDDSYLNSVLYGGRFYRPDEISQNVRLQQIMDNVARINNNATNASKLYNDLKGIINYTDYGDSVGNYLNYDSSQHYISNKAIREYLANTPYAAVFDATPAYGVNGERIYGIYDFGKNGENPYGFRNPYYLVVDDKGNLRLNSNNQSNWSEEDLRGVFDFLNRDYGEANDFARAREVINGKSYGRIDITDRVDGSSYHFVVDDSGNVYHVKNNGELELMDPDLATRVLNGEQIVPNDIDVSRRKARHPEKYNPNWHPTISRKEGGKIKELPLKLQAGSKLLTKSSIVEELKPVNDRMSQSSQVFDYKWSELSDADKKDMVAAGMDVLGAIASLIPSPWTLGAGVVTGLGATGLMTAADKQRDHIHWGRTAVSAGMDLLGALPVIGSTAKFAKIGKAFAKSPRLWNNISKAFIAAGFANAVPTLQKLVTEGPKNLTTDDLYALSGAVQASLGLGARARHSAGDSRLAHMISETDAAKKASATAATTATTPQHSVKSKYATDIEVKLSDADVADIKGAKENAADVLRTKLKESYNIDPATIEKDNTALLKQFGFEVKEGVPTPIEGTTHTVSSKRIKGGTEDTFKLEQDDVDYVLKGGENAGKRLRERLLAKDMDPNLINADDKALLKEFGFDVKMTKGENPKIASITESKPTVKEKVKEKVSGAKKAFSGDDKYSKYGYLSDLWGGARKRRAYIEEAMKTPEVRSEVDATLANLGLDEGVLAKRAYGRAQYRIGEDPTKIGTVNWGRRYSWVPGEESSTGETVKQEVPKQEVVKENSTSSEKTNTPVETKRVVESPIKSPEDIPAELRTNNDILALPSAERLALPENTGEAAIVLRDKPIALPATSKNYKQASMEKRAANLRRLQKSQNPLKTLTDLQKQDSDKLFTNEEEFNAVMQALIRKNAATRGNNTTNGQRYMANLVNKVKELKRIDRLYKQGGILKQQFGGTTGLPGLYDDLLKKRIADLKRQSEMMKTEPLPIGPKMTPAQAQTSTNSLEETIKQSRQNEIQKGIDAHTSKMGYNYRNWETDQRIPYWGLRAAQYLGVLGFQKKDRDLGHKQVEAARFHESPVTLNQYRTDSPALQHAENNLQQQQMNGLKATTSDVSLYYAHKLAQQKAINDYLKDLTAQKSAFESQMNMQNVGIQNQNIANAVQTANSNAARDASINSAHYTVDREYNTNRKQSFENGMLEVTNALKLDNEKLLKLGQLHAWEGFDRNYENALAGVPGYSEWKNTYENDPELRKKYSTLDDYIEAEHPESWGLYRNTRDAAEKARQKAQYEWTVRNGLIIPRPNAGFNGPAGYRKGGRVNGTTRYTLEPDERIWIDNNKAAHAKAAKLSDATIKLLLRALK